jgi:hypothetical protein
LLEVVAADYILEVAAVLVDYFTTETKLQNRQMDPH